MTTIDQIRSDLAKFADVGTEVTLDKSNYGALIKLSRNGERSYWINRAGLIEARHDRGRQYTAVSNLLASREFADIERLLSAQSRIYPMREFAGHLEPFGTVTAPEGSSLELSFEVFKARCDPSERQLRLILVDGLAGVGKTNLIRRLVASRASGEGPRVPVLYVSSRGRRLASLDEVIAVSIQDLNVFSFGYQQVPVLMRHGLLQIAIDGFDELAEPEGYRGAWYTLSTFLEQAGHAGPVLLAGRDTFFDAQKIRSSLERFGSRPLIETARLLPVSQNEAVEWLNERGWNLRPDSEDAQTFLDEGSLLLRPFFLAKLAPIKSFDELAKTSGDPWAYLINDFLDRETNILTSDYGVD